MADIKKLAEELVNLTVKEVNELAAILKDEYGIEPAAAGAVMGGVIAADKGGKRQVVTGYRTERQCSNQTVYETRRELTDYTVSYEILGVTQRANVSRKYRVGDSIPVQVHIGLR